MAHRIEKEEGGTEAVVWDGFERGIAPSPHKGIANMRAVNINTELGEVMCSYQRERSTQSQSTTTGTLTRLSTSTVSFGSPAPQNGTWIAVSGSSITGLSNGNYYVMSSSKIAAAYQTDTANAVTGMGAGTATWTSTSFQMALPVQGAVERYVDTSAVTQYRYYVIDVNSRLWVNDTAITTVGGEPMTWFLPYPTALTGTCTGMTVAFGFVHIFMNSVAYTVATARLGTAPASFSAGNLIAIPGTTDPHFAFTGTQGRVYFTMGQYIGSIFPDISIDPGLSTAVANIQSYCSYTRSSSTAGNIKAVLNGAIPNDNNTLTRLPVFFLTGYGGTQPTNLTAGTKYYIECNSQGDFLVYAAQVGGSAINIATGAVGDQYFNTYYPQSSAGNDLMVYTPQRMELPSYEIATTIAELGNNLIIGTQSNKLYPWNQVDPTPSDVISMPEANTSWMVTVENVVYVGAGYRGNIYITNASSLSLATSVPDYCSGLVEPYFIWGGAMFLRGRVYFSIQDQTASHTGQCGGVWSFIPVQNFSYGQDYGMAMRMENKNSYNTFNGRDPVLLPLANQQARGPQYFSAWISSITSSQYGIDSSGTVTGTAALIETDIVEVGTLLNKKNFKQIEYKLSVPLDTTSNPETVSLAYRLNLKDAFTTITTMVVESADNLSGYVTVDFQNAQWLQLQATLTPNSDSTTSFVRLTELRAR